MLNTLKCISSPRRGNHSSSLSELLEKLPKKMNTNFIHSAWNLQFFKYLALFSQNWGKLSIIVTIPRNVSLFSGFKNHCNFFKGSLQVSSSSLRVLLYIKLL